MKNMNPSTPNPSEPPSPVKPAAVHLLLETAPQSYEFANLGFPELLKTLGEAQRKATPAQRQAAQNAHQAEARAKEAANAQFLAGAMHNPCPGAPPCTLLPLAPLALLATTCC